MGDTEHQARNSPAEHLKSFQFKKGVSGNPGGRPKGTVSLKTYARNYLMGLSEEEKYDFMEGLNKIDVWKMAEGNAKQDTSTDIKVTMPTPILGGAVLDVIEAKEIKEIE
jgi:hypothetical protein